MDGLYKVVKNTDLSAFEEECDTYIGKGYTPVGSIVIVINMKTLYVQPFMKPSLNIFQQK